VCVCVCVCVCACVCGYKCPARARTHTHTRTHLVYATLGRESGSEREERERNLASARGVDLQYQ
jgi:hypothetical protein